MTAWQNKRRDTVEGGRPPKGTTLNVLEDYDLAEGKSLMISIRR